MTQGRDGISLAPKRAQGLMVVARRLSGVAAMLVVAALLAGTAGTSYAQAKVHKHAGPTILDTVTVTNYGAAFGGSLATYKAGSGQQARPFLWVKGVNTLLGAGTGPAGVSVSSLDDHVGVSVPIDLIDLTGFGGFPAALVCTGAGAPVPCCTGFHAGNCEAGTGFAEIFSPGADKNSVPENIIGTRNATFGNVAFKCKSLGVPFPCCTGLNAGTCNINVSGVNTAQAIAFEDPFDGVHPGRDIVAIGNTLPINFFSTTDFLDGTNGGAACNSFGSGTCTGPMTPQKCCTGKGTGTCAGFTVGTITEFDRETLKPGFNDLVAPFNNNPVCILPAAALAGGEPPTFCPPGSTSNTTIGGCLTFLLGPVGLAFDETGFLFAVNEAAVAQGGPGFVTAYSPDAFGDAFPAAIIGLIPGSPTAGAFKDPVKIAVLSDTDFNEDVIFVTDVGDNSVKIFAPFTNFETFFFTGTQLGTIKGGATKFDRPEGVAVSAASGALYVVNNDTNSFEMFTDIGAIVLAGGTQNISPTLIVQGRNTRLNLPVDIALPGFTPSGRPSSARN
jgi:hypothetical protein